MHFQIYIPGLTGHHQHRMAEVGLGHLYADAEYLPVPLNGPDGGSGGVLSWGNAKGQHDLSGVEWTPAVPDPAKALPAGRYYVGTRPGSLPTPAELAYATQLQGRTVRLGDGRDWLIPAAAMVPRGYGLTADGSGINTSVIPQWEWFWDLSQHWFDELILSDEGGQNIAVDRSVFDYATVAMGINYRVVPEIVSQLCLLTTESLASVLLTTVSGHEINQERINRKKKDRESHVGE